jgi:hypothetical protein
MTVSCKRYFRLPGSELTIHVAEQTVDPAKYQYSGIEMAG